jgi:hypothetical protein
MSIIYCSLAGVAMKYISSTDDCGMDGDAVQEAGPPFVPQNFVQNQLPQVVRKRYAVNGPEALRYNGEADANERFAA